MTSAPLTPIPTPLAQRLRDLRLRLLPILALGGCVAVIAVLWHNDISMPQLTGQAEPVLARLSSYKAGTLAALNVVRFQKVKTGEILGQVLASDPKVIEASLAVMRAELEQFRSGFMPASTQQGAAMNYVQLRLDWMRQRVTLATGRVNLQLAEVELRRTQELFNGKIAAQSELDIAQATRDGLRSQVGELEKLIAESEKSIQQIVPADTGDSAKTFADPIPAALAVQEAKLRQMEAEFAPIELRAPLDGIVTAVNHRPGESVTAGEPIIAISSQAPVRIVGYLRSPNLDLAKVGMKVRVRTRNTPRTTGLAQITEVGMQLEPPPLALSSPFKSANDLALPLEISLPANLNLRPGELVDLTLVSAGE